MDDLSTLDVERLRTLIELCRSNGVHTLKLGALELGMVLSDAAMQQHVGSSTTTVDPDVFDPDVGLPRSQAEIAWRRSQRGEES